jgi:GNAT superfamily N-acetyltransferase
VSGGLAFSVRQARDEELEAAGDVVADAYRPMPGMGAGHPYLDEVRDARGRSGEVEVLVAVDDAGCILGSVSYVRDHTSPYAELEVEGEAGFRMLGVAEAARGRGVGRALVEACVERARAASRRGVALSTDPRWTTAQRVYERAGFRHVPERDFAPVPGVFLWAYVLDL